MKLLILGRGVIGTQYGWALEKAGHEVEFYVRKSSTHTYADHVELHTYDGRRKVAVDENWPITLRYEIGEGEAYDLILVSVNPEQIDGALKTIAPVAGNAAILLMGNTMGNPIADGQELYGINREQFIIGFPGAGGGFHENVLHGILHPMIQMGSSGNELSENEQKVKKLFEGAGFRVSVHRDIRTWLINHYVLNAAMEAEVLKRGSFERVVSSGDGLEEMLKNAKEMIVYLKAKGIKPDLALKVMSILPAGWMAGLMKKTLYKPGSAAYDAVSYNRYDPGFAVREIAEDAHKLGITLPRLEKALAGC